MLKYLFQKTKTSGNISIKNRYKSKSWLRLRESNPLRIILRTYSMPTKDHERLGKYRDISTTP